MKRTLHALRYECVIQISVMPQMSFPRTLSAFIVLFSRFARIRCAAHWLRTHNKSSEKVRNKKSSAFFLPLSLSVGERRLPKCPNRIVGWHRTDLMHNRYEIQRRISRTLLTQRDKDNVEFRCAHFLFFSIVLWFPEKIGCIEWIIDTGMALKSKIVFIYLSVLSVVPTTCWFWSHLSIIQRKDDDGGKVLPFTSEFWSSCQEDKGTE